MNDIEYLRQVSGQFAMPDEGADNRLASIATKHEQMARAVLEAWDRYSTTRYPSARAFPAGIVLIATGKPPSDWTRDGLMEYLGIAQEADE